MSAHAARTQAALRSAPQARAAPRVRMAPPLRWAIFGVGGLLWLTGALWLVAHWGFPQHNEFGALPNPWEPWLMRLHGVLAVGGVFLLGWVAAGHIPAGWKRALNRLSGLWLTGFLIVLVASGYALYYSTGALHQGSAALHEWLGILVIVSALTHWLRIRAAR